VGRIDEKTTFDRSDFRNVVPRFRPENRKANQALIDLLGTVLLGRVDERDFIIRD
jgi:hypothetical protein